MDGLFISIVVGFWLITWAMIWLFERIGQEGQQ